MPMTKPRSTAQVLNAATALWLPIVVAAALVPILSPGGLFAQEQKESNEVFAQRIRDLLKKNGLGEQAEPRARIVLPDDKIAPFFSDSFGESDEPTVATPRARVRPLAPSVPSAFQSLDIENKGRALNALDEVIKDDRLRELELR